MTGIRSNIENRHSWTAVTPEGGGNLRFILSQGKFEVGFAERAVLSSSGQLPFSYHDGLSFRVVHHSPVDGADKSPIAFRAAPMRNGDVSPPPHRAQKRLQELEHERHRPPPHGIVSPAESRRSGEPALVSRGGNESFLSVCRTAKPRARLACWKTCR